MPQDIVGVVTGKPPVAKSKRLPRLSHSSEHGDQEHLVTSLFRTEGGEMQESSLPPAVRQVSRSFV